MSNTDFWGEEQPRRGNGKLSAVQPRQDRSTSRKRDKRDKRKRRGGGAAVMAAVIFLAVVLGGSGYFGYSKLKDYMQPGDYTGQGTGSVTIEVADGDFTTKVGQTLQKADVVKTVKAFTQAAGTRLAGLQPGFYRMRRQMSSASAVSLLLDPAAKAGVVNI
ncbi:MAG: endolytic transglycosylase MltG, partial [Streptosporangiaceae bacterium]